jgi:hypothetical protein
VTNASGIATAPLALNIAPGVYPLAATFASDGVYGPSSTSASFTVTESWSEWIQDSAADFGLGTGSGVDLTTNPGSLLLLSQQFGEGEESGSFPLGSQNWSYRRRIFIDNPNTSQLPTGYSLKLTVDTAALVSAGKSLASGDDLRLVWTGGSSPLELDRVADTAFNTIATELWFKSQAPIPASSRDSAYYIYYGNPAAGAPPANPTNVFALYDGFDDTTVNTTLWTQTGTVTESGGWARLSAGGDLFSKQPFTYGMLEMRIQAPAEDNYMWWGWEDGVTDAPNFMVFEEHPAPTNFAALLRNDNNPHVTLAITQPAGGLAVPHTYATEWRPGTARWYIDGAQVQSASTGLPDTPMSVNFYANLLAYNIDWVRGRLLAAQEPIVALASTYQGYVSQGTFTSVAFDTGGTSDWKYLVWDALKPSGTGLTLRLRTAPNQGGLATAAWVDYSQSGLWITNPAARWIQYETGLTTNDSLVTPELRSITLYYLTQPISPPPPLPASFYGQIHFNEYPPDVGTPIEAWVTGMSVRAATTTVQAGSPLYYTSFDVPGDDPGTPQKDGGVDGDLVSFKIGVRILATAPWHSGTHTQVDLNSYAIHLQQGWNLVSFNLRPAITAPASVLSSLGTNYDLVYAWNAAGQNWLIHDQIPSTPDSLTVIDEATGFWIHITAGSEVILYVTGSLPTSTDISLSATGAGWNLVGFPAAGTIALPDVLRDHGVGTSYSLVYAYHVAEADPWKMFDRLAPGWVNDLSGLTPGWGYWVQVTGTETLHWSVSYP